MFHPIESIIVSINFLKNGKRAGILQHISAPFSERIRSEVKKMQFVIAFVVGGLICVIGQLLIDFTKLTPARILVTFVTLGVALTAIGVYEPLVDFAGAGATVPLTGFGYTLAIGVREAVQDFGWIGIFTGGLTAAAAGIAAAVGFGYLAALCSRSGDKA